MPRSRCGPSGRSSAGGAPTSIQRPASSLAGRGRVVHLNDIASVGATLVDALRALGLDAELVTPWRPPTRIRYPWRAATLPLRGAALAMAAARVRRRRPSLVHLHYARFAWLATLVGAPYLVHCHGTDIRGAAPGSAWGRSMAPWLRRATAVIYATPDLEPWARAFRPDATFVPNPIVVPDLATLAPDEPQADLLVGVRLEAGKAADRVVDTLARLLALRPATTVTIIAQGPQLGRARQAAPAARVIDPLPHAELPGLLAAHRAALGQMGVGALGNYELEAMACGLAVVAAFRFPDAYAASPPLVAADDPAAAAERLAELLDDEPARAELGAAARNWVATHHGTEVVGRRMIELYRDLGVLTA